MDDDAQSMRLGTSLTFPNGTKLALIRWTAQAGRPVSVMPGPATQVYLVFSHCWVGCPDMALVLPLHASLLQVYISGGVINVAAKASSPSGAGYFLASTSWDAKESSVLENQTDWHLPSAPQTQLVTHASLLQDYVSGAIEGGCHSVLTHSCWAFLSLHVLGC